jgi:hypothetical protein
VGTKTIDSGEDINVPAGKKSRRDGNVTPAVIVQHDVHSYDILHGN